MEIKYQLNQITINNVTFLSHYSGRYNQFSMSSKGIGLSSTNSKTLKINSYG